MIQYTNPGIQKIFELKPDDVCVSIHALGIATNSL
jgi:hypothetical protein